MIEESKKTKYDIIEEKYSLIVNNIENEINNAELHLNDLKRQRDLLFKEIINCKTTEAWK